MEIGYIFLVKLVKSTLMRRVQWMLKINDIVNIQVDYNISQVPKAI